MAVSKRLRYEILRRDNHTCRYCGASAPDVQLRVDHVTPVAVDSAVVADVADDALRWAAAMEQAAASLLEQEKPKLEYRAAFLKEWNRWGYGEGDERKTLELPGDWKPSIERFRIAGLPAWVWAEIVDTAMGYEKVLNDNKFKYCCGIAWNKVTAMQEEARRIVGARPASSSLPPLTAALVATAIEVWRRETDEDLTAEQEAELACSVAAATKDELDEGDILQAIRYAAWFGQVTVDEGLEHVETDNVAVQVMRWEHTWLAASGSYPSEEETATFQERRQALRKAGVSDQILVTAASVAGFALSCVPHFGINADQLSAAGINPKKQTAEDFWALSFVASAARWPTAEERRKFTAQLERLGDDGGYLIFDANAAAVAAGAAQEADLYWNLPRQLSALLAAGSPLQDGEN